MKHAALIALAMLLAAFVATAYLFITSTVSVAPVGVVVTEASEQPAAFQELAHQAQTGLVIGTAFKQETLSDAEDYVFYTYSVRLTNNSRLTADMIELQITPMDDDVLQMAESAAYSLKSGTKGDISATILTKRGSQTVRQVTVSYYFWGLPFTEKLVCGR